MVYSDHLTHMLGLTPRDIRWYARHPMYDAIRESYRKWFPPVMGMFRRHVPDDELIKWWRSFLLSNTIQPPGVMEVHLRDGWASGKHYGDC